MPTKKTAKKKPVKKAAPPANLKPRANNVAGMTAMDKAKQFAQFARDNEWWAGVKTIKDTGNIIVTVKRDDGRYKETITVEWSGNRVTKNGIVYTIEGQDRALLVHNLAAARHHISGDKLFKREVKERRRKRAPKRHLRVLGGDGSEVEESDDAPRYTPVGAHVVDKWYDIVVSKTKKAKGKTVRKVIARIEGVGPAQVESMRRIWEADGLDVTVQDRAAS